jgi:hypothetical protein
MQMKERSVERRQRRIVRACSVGLVFGLGLVICTDVATAAYTPAPDELAFLALTNEARASSGLRPLVWHDGLGASARFHSEDMADHGCFQHDSCNGQNWRTRIGRYYSGWAVGENIGLGGGNPRLTHEDWMAAPGHHANILGAYSEFGAGSALHETNFGDWEYATEVFGERGAVPLSAIPTIPAGGVIPRIGLDLSRELLVNYYHQNGGAPQAVRALVGSSCVNLQKKAGSNTNGTWGTMRSFVGSGCVPVVFEAVRSDGVRVRWPEGKALLVGVGAGGLFCAETTTSIPTQDCGGGPFPTPAPTPVATPTPGGGGASLDDLRVVLRPTRADASVATVNVQATVSAGATFDPTSGPVTLSMDLGSTEWQMTIPAQCGDAPCLKANNQRTAYRGKVEDGTVSLVRSQHGGWRMRWVARQQEMGFLGAGAVDVTLRAGGSTYTGSVDGEIKSSALIAR